MMISFPCPHKFIISTPFFCRRRFQSLFFFVHFKKVLLSVGRRRDKNLSQQKLDRRRLLATPCTIGAHTIVDRA